MTTEDFKIEGFKRQIELIKENKELDGNITRPEIADLERSIRLIEWGRQQATKEILEEEIRFCQELWDKAEEYTCDGWVLILAGNRMEDIKQQLKKLGEEEK